MILKIGNIGLIRNPQMVFLNDFKILLEPYIKCEFFDVQDFKDVISKEQAFEIIQDNLIKGVPLNNVALEIYLDDENIRIDGNGTYEKDCIKFVNGFDAMRNMDKLLEPFSEYLSFSKDKPFVISFINEEYKNSLERIIKNSESSMHLMLLPVEERLLTVLSGLRFKSSFLDFLFYELIDFESTLFYTDERLNTYLNVLLRGMKNRNSVFSHERESEQTRLLRER